MQRLEIEILSVYTAIFGGNSCFSIKFINLFMYYVHVGPKLDLVKKYPFSLVCCFKK